MIYSLRLDYDLKKEATESFIKTREYKLNEEFNENFTSFMTKSIIEKQQE